MPAMASPRTNLEAPSMDPKNSASRRYRCGGDAFSSPIRPALRSASMAICLPGMASRVKRAETSATQPAPLVMTTKLITVRMRKTTIPTANSRRPGSGRRLVTFAGGIRTGGPRA